MRKIGGGLRKQRPRKLEVICLLLESQTPQVRRNPTVISDSPLPPGKIILSNGAEGPIPYPVCLFPIRQLGAHDLGAAAAGYGLRMDALLLSETPPQVRVLPPHYPCLLIPLQGHTAFSLPRPHQPANPQCQADSRHLITMC